MYSSVVGKPNALLISCKVANARKHDGLAVIACWQSSMADLSLPHLLLHAARFVSSAASRCGCKASLYLSIASVKASAACWYFFVW